MKSGLGDRNNYANTPDARLDEKRLNEVRSWRPEQLDASRFQAVATRTVSMKSGLGDRNNQFRGRTGTGVGAESQ